MQHVHVPIQSGDEVCCYRCGEVLDRSVEYPDKQQSTIGGELIYPGLDVLMVGLSLERSMNWKNQTNEALRDYQNLLNKFLDLCKKESLPDMVAYETVKRLLKKKRGLYSYRLQIKELLDVLRDDNRLVFKVNMIKHKYEMVSGI